MEVALGGKFITQAWGSSRTTENIVVNPHYSEGCNFLWLIVTLGRMKINIYSIIRGVRKRSKTGATVGIIGGNPYITTFSFMKMWHIMSHTTAHSALPNSNEISEETGAKKCQSHSKYVSQILPQEKACFILFTNNLLYSVDRCSILFSLKWIFCPTENL